MRNLSFSLTTRQMRERTKSVTRRCGPFWLRLKPGELVCAVEKSQGIKKGGLVRIGTIRIVRASTESLDSISQDEVDREGFPDLTPAQFVAMFLRHMPAARKSPHVVRIEFEHVVCECPHLDVEHGSSGCDFCPCAALVPLDPSTMTEV